MTAIKKCKEILERYENGDAEFLGERVMVNHTRLVQRLSQPAESERGKLISHAFAGGGGGIGFSKEAYALLDEVFTIEYMGAAEYEFGQMPKTLAAMRDDHESLVGYSFTIKAKDIKPHYKRKKGERAENNATVYVVCREQHKEYTTALIKLLARDKIDVKAHSMFNYTIDPASDHDKNTVGWLEENNGMFFSTDKVMWEKFSKLFGVDN